MLTASIRNSLSGIKSPAQWFLEMFRPNESDSGVTVNVDSVLGCPPVWYAVSKIAGNVGRLPMNLMRHSGRMSEKAEFHPAHRLMKDDANEFQHAGDLREQLTMHALLCGQGRAAIVRNGGIPTELIPMLPHKSVVCVVEGQKWHVVSTTPDDRLFNANVPIWEQFREGHLYKIRDADVLDIKGLSYNGHDGVPLIRVARDALGLGLAGQKAAARAFKNNAKPGLLLQAPHGTFSNEQDAKEFIEAFNSAHAGIDNQGRAGMLRDGITATVLPMSAQEAQWIEQRIYQRQETALLFCLESILGDNASVSYNSAEQKDLAYLKNCLDRWLTKWERECERKLIGVASRRSHYFKFNAAALLRTDYKTTVESLGIGITHKILNPNEAREKLDLNPYDGGDDYENPAITPGQGDDTGNEETEEESPASSNLRQLLTQARRQAIDATSQQTNFVDWIERRYGSENIHPETGVAEFTPGTWENTLSRAIAGFGGDKQIAEEYCRSIRAELMSLTERVTSEELVEAVHHIASRWPEDAKHLASQIPQKEIARV